MSRGWRRFCEARIGGLVISNDGFFNNERDRLIAPAACYSFPAAYEFPECSAEGGLFSLVSSFLSVPGLVVGGPL